MDGPTVAADVVAAAVARCVAAAAAAGGGVDDANVVAVAVPVGIVFAVVSAEYVVAATVSVVDAVAFVAVAPRRGSADSMTTPVGTTWLSVARTVAETDEAEAPFQTLSDEHVPEAKEGGEPESTGRAGRHGMDDANTVDHDHAHPSP